MDNQNTSTSDSNAMVVGSSPPMAAGSNMLSSANSLGLMFEQSIRQQQNDFQIGLAKTIKSTPNLLAKRINIKGRKVEFKNALAAALLEMEGL